MDLLFTVLAVGAACAFAVVNGMTDSPHTFGPPVRTGALTPRIALAMSALLTGLGALVSTGIALQVMDSLTIPEGRPGHLILFAGALSAAAWGLVAHAARMPTSSTSALISALLGASLAAGQTGHATVRVADHFLLLSVVLPLAISPLVAYGTAYAAANGLTLVRRRTSAHTVRRQSRRIQAVTSALYATAHGVQDGQRTVFLITAALAGAGMTTTGGAMTAVVVSAAALIGAGALFGSWRIARTLSHRMTRLDPHSAAIGTGTAAVLLLGGLAMHWPLSSAYLSTACLAGASEASPFKPTRWRTVLQILLFWLATPLGAGFLGAFVYLAFTALAA